MRITSDPFAVTRSISPVPTAARRASPKQPSAPARPTMITRLSRRDQRIRDSTGSQVAMHKWRCTSKMCERRSRQGEGAGARAIWCWGPALIFRVAVRSDLVLAPMRVEGVQPLEHHRRNLDCVVSNIECSGDGVWSRALSLPGTGSADGMLPPITASCA